MVLLNSNQSVQNRSQHLQMLQKGSTIALAKSHSYHNGGLIVGRMIKMMVMKGRRQGGLGGEVGIQRIRSFRAIIAPKRLCKEGNGRVTSIGAK
jgi:hypothetical protein